MKILSKLLTIIRNIKCPRYSIIYRKADGSTNCYILQNPSIFQGNQRVTYSNDQWRKTFGIQNRKGFRALVIGKGVRSFDWQGIQNIQKLSAWEVVK